MILLSIINFDMKNNVNDEDSDKASPENLFKDARQTENPYKVLGVE